MEVLLKINNLSAKGAENQHKFHALNLLCPALVSDPQCSENN